MISTDIGIDLGTASILVYVKGKGVVLKEPSVVAFDRDTNKIKAIGEEARLMLGRTPGNIVAVRPLRQGVISDYTVTEKMMKYFIQKAVGKKTFRKPLVSVCVPSGVTEVEKKAVEDATFQAGARDVKIIEEPIAAAIGAGIDISKPCGNMIVDIGGGTADIAVISLGGTVVSTSIKIAGDDFDEAIVRYMRKKHNLLIGERTAEDIKIKIGTCYPLPEPMTMDVRGRNLVTGLPKTVTVSSEETEEALREATLQIVDAVHSVLEKTPPELAADVRHFIYDEEISAAPDHLLRKIFRILYRNRMKTVLAAGAVLGDSYLVAAAVNQEEINQGMPTFQLQLLGVDNRILKAWTPLVRQREELARMRTIVTLVDGRTVVTTESNPESFITFSIARNNLFTLGEKNNDQIYGQDVPLDLSNEKELVMDVNPEWEALEAILIN